MISSEANLGQTKSRRNSGFWSLIRFESHLGQASDSISVGKTCPASQVTNQSHFDWSESGIVSIQGNGLLGAAAHSRNSETRLICIFRLIVQALNRNWKHWSSFLTRFCFGRPGPKEACCHHGNQTGRNVAAGAKRSKLTPQINSLWF